ncbi:MAG: nucleotidyltransferase family protein [Alphaproteobacteria bacterium]|nr:nucleotidyltransferase family protein [Alphaproteobacteria bacterium]
MTRDDVLRLIEAAPWRVAALEAVRALDLPDGWIGAGFVRAPVLDALHGYDRPTPLDDIDVIYFDPRQHSVALDMHWENVLQMRMPGLPWSVHNQARMHMRNGDTPYRDMVDALSHWLETPTAVAVRIGAAGSELLAPFGIDDLVGLTLRPTPAGRRKPTQFRERAVSKGWAARWSNLRLTMD